ncbi:hypothetical protein P3T35_007562 [Kitasatospora sp. GP30]|nr:hypothetical protein [Kitasatospora sp. GP30]
MHPLDELRPELAALVSGRRRRTGERLPSGDGCGVRSPPSGVGPSCGHSGSATAIETGEARRREEREAGFRGDEGRSEAAAEGRVRSPPPCRWFGEPLIPSDAFGVGSSHSTSSARFGPWPPRFLFSGCWLPPLEPMLLVGVFSNAVVGGPGGEEDPGAVVGCSDVGGAKNEPFRVVPELGQGAEYGAKCPQIRLSWVVSQTPRAAFQVARGGGDGGGGEQSSYILDHQEVRAQGLDSASHVQPKTGSGFGVESGAAAGDRDVFDRGSPP